MISLKSTTSNNTFWNNSNRNNLSKIGSTKKSKTTNCHPKIFFTKRNFSLSDFDNLFLLPKCAFASDKKMSLRRDLATYNFNINIVADTPKGNVWICKFMLHCLFQYTRKTFDNKSCSLCIILCCGIEITRCGLCLLWMMSLVLWMIIGMGISICQGPRKFWEA